MIFSAEPLLRRRAGHGRQLPQVHLEIVRGRARQRVRPIRGPAYLIGRSSNCDLVLGDPQFPDVHSYLFLTDHGVSLRCVARSPEITIDGRRVQSGEVFHGDRLRTGPYEFRLLIEWGEERSVGSPCWLAELHSWRGPFVLEQLMLDA